MGDAGAYANTRLRVKPPDRGSFPLDHNNVCQGMRDKWMACMEFNGWDSSKCRGQSAAYLRCRMDNNLMSREEMTNLGFNNAEWDQAGQIYTKN